MPNTMPDDLWREFPKTAPAFEARFKTEDDCRAYWIKARWGGKPACAKCKATRVWTIRLGTTFECAECGHQTSLTSGTVLEKTRKPLKMWFRAIFEISTRRTGISAKDLQRIMGFGSYETAWMWLHKLRSAMVRSDSEPLGPFVEMDEALVGGKGGPHKQLVLAAAEKDGRVRLAHADNNDAETCKHFVDGEVATTAAVTTDGHAGYNDTSIGERKHNAVVQTKAEKRAVLSLDNLAAEALADRHARWRDEAEALAGVSRRVRLSPQPPQDRWRRAHRRPRDRKRRRQATIDDAGPGESSTTAPPVRVSSDGVSLS
jgi:transposase-like protein